MTKEEFQTKWDAIKAAVWALAVSMYQAFPKKEWDPKETDEDRRKHRQEKWRALNNLHGQVEKMCQKHGLEMLHYPFNYLNDLDEPTELRDWWYRAAYYESVEDPAWIGEVEVHGLPLITINAPGWFKDPDFVEWLKAPRTATWHPTGSDDPDEYADVFFSFCDGDGSDSPCGGSEQGPHIPQGIWDYIEFAVNKELGIQNECIVRVTNLEV